nr:MAG TPA: hypothetical protein [Caudoviricetes sp.]
MIGVIPNHYFVIVTLLEISTNKFHLSPRSNSPYFSHPSKTYTVVRPLHSRPLSLLENQKCNPSRGCILYLYPLDSGSLIERGVYCLFILIKI